jgi:site-specific recombinase XerC
MLVRPTSLNAAFDDYVLAQRTRKLSVHTIRAWRVDYKNISNLLGGGAAATLTVDVLTLKNLRHAFGDYADTHEAASIQRTWSTWDRFLDYLVADDEIPPVGPVRGVSAYGPTRTIGSFTRRRTSSATLPRSASPTPVRP